MTEDILMRVFFGLFVICLIMATLSLRDPARYALFCKVRTRVNGFFMWMGLAVLCAVAVAFTAPKDRHGNVIIPEDPERAAVQRERAAPSRPE